MKKKRMIILGIFLILIPFISASSFYFNFEIVTIKQNTCFNFPTSCDNCTYMNITFLFPNGTIAIDNQEMTNLTSDYYYNYSFCNTSTLGTYIAIINYDEDGKYYSDFDFFKVTPSGREAPNSGEGTIFLASIISMILMTILFFSFSFTVERESGLRFGFLAISLVMGVITTLYSSVSLMETYGGFSRTLNSFSIFQYIILAVLLIIFIFVLVSLIVSALNAWQIKKGLKDENQ